MSDTMVKLGWKKLLEGAIVEAGTAREFHTGGWRSERPIFNEENCLQCFICWFVCPDMAVSIKDDKVIGFDYTYCKGCGICAKECPSKPDKRAITMEREKK